MSSALFDLPENELLDRIVKTVAIPQYERRENDFYETPAWCVDVLLRHVSFERVWEPACGRGAISKELIKRAIEMRSTDLVDRGYGIAPLDFLQASEPRDSDIITNPPYNLAEEFVRHALAVTKQHGRKVAMLLRNEWDSAGSRADLYRYPFALKLVLTRRPRWIEGTTGSPRHNYAWFVWDWATDHLPTIRHDH